MILNHLNLGLGCFLICTPLSYVRKIEKFGFSYLLADVLIFVTTVVIFVYALLFLKSDEFIAPPESGFEPINTATWLSMIGSAVYAYEGIGTILPILDVT